MKQKQVIETNPKTATIPCEVYESMMKACLAMADHQGDSIGQAEFFRMRDMACVAVNKAQSNQAMQGYVLVCETLIDAAQYTASLLAKIPAFGDSIGSEVGKAQLGNAHHRLMIALTALHRNEKTN